MATSTDEQKSATASRVMQTFLLKGWVLTNNFCAKPECPFPQLRSKDRKTIFCPSCDQPPTANASSASAAPTQSAASTTLFPTHQRDLHLSQPPLLPTEDPASSSSSSYPSHAHVEQLAVSTARQEEEGADARVTRSPRETDAFSEEQQGDVGDGRDADAPEADDRTAEGGDEADRTNTVAVDERGVRDRERRRQQSARAAALTGQKMLQGYAMMDVICPNGDCYAIPLLRDRKQRLLCVNCGGLYKRTRDAPTGQERLELLVSLAVAATSQSSTVGNKRDASNALEGRHEPASQAKAPVRTRFRPCIDLHDGKVKQIIGGSLSTSGEHCQTNFVSERPPGYYARLYREHNLTGGHLIKLGPGNDAAAKAALGAWKGGLQLGGGVTLENAQEWLDCGADKVIVTSWLFPSGCFDLERLKQLSAAVSREKLVVDLSCRKRGGRWFVAIDKWQTVTDLELNEATLDAISQYCCEFLVHAADVEGLCRGIDEDLVSNLGRWVKVPTTYAGGASDITDLELVDRLSNGKVDLTFGSALDLFGGRQVPFSACVAWNGPPSLAV